MTLLLMVGQSDNFVAMSTDKRQVETGYWYYPKTKTYERIKGMAAQAKEGDFPKTFKLSNFTLIGSGGNAELGNYLKDEMRRTIEAEDDLDNCYKRLDKIINDARKLKEQEHFFYFLDEEDGITVVIAGFYRDGSVGSVTFSSGLNTQVEKQKLLPDQEQYAMIPPFRSYLPMAKQLLDVDEFADMDLFYGDNFMRVEDENPAWRELFSRQIKWIHKVIATAHPVEVSSDGDIHYLTLQKDGEIEYSVKGFTTDNVSISKLKKQTGL